MREIEEHWDINDLYDANEALDIRAEAEEYSANKARSKK